MKFYNTLAALCKWQATVRQTVPKVFDKHKRTLLISEFSFDTLVDVGADVQR